MQIVFWGDNLHEISNPVFLGGEKEKYFKTVPVEILAQHAYVLK